MSPLGQAAGEEEALGHEEEEDGYGDMQVCEHVEGVGDGHMEDGVIDLCGDDFIDMCGDSGESD